jgi:hypothetical protein
VPDALEQLYAAGPDEFVAVRKELERALRDEGRTEEANEIAALRKPSAPVFAANRLAREHQDDVAALIDAGDQLVTAHGHGDADALRKAQRELAHRVTTLVRHAELSGAMEQRLAVLLRAAASDPDSAAQLRRGALQEEVEPASFDALAGISLAPPKKRPKPERGAERAREKERRARVKELERELANARAELKRAERRVAQLEGRLEDVRGTV